jgi:outer membrane protein X
LEPSINYFFENDGLDMFDINANAHYIFPMASNVRVYPLAGFSFSKWSANAGDGWEVSTSKFGVNLGGGAEFDISDNLMMNFELKYQLISKFDQSVISMGVAYMF